VKLDIKYYPDPILKVKAIEIKEITDNIKKMAYDMIETMDAYNGVGLAANQIGEAIKILVLRPEIKNDKGEIVLGDPEIYINSIFSNPSIEKDVMVEGCLSFPGIHIEIERPVKIHVEALDINGKKISEDFYDFRARVLMHENDHLNGKVFIERAHKKDKEFLKEALKKLRKSRKL